MMTHSEREAADFGYPWVDRLAAKVYLAPVTARGLDEARRFMSAPAIGYSPAILRFRQVLHSRAVLDQIMHASVGPQPEGMIVYSSYPDPENDRIVLDVDVVQDSFLWRLSRVYGPTAVAVRLVTGNHNGGTVVESREYDSNQFIGGANINSCTSGFAWNSGATEMMLTAGHCFSSGGYASTPAAFVGSVTVNDEESWNVHIGTVYMTGESTYRGDIALIRITAGSASAPWLYRGGYNSSSTNTVVGRWGGSPHSGDQYCTGGRMSGEQCGWTVQWSAAGDRYYPPDNATARRVWLGTKHGLCMIGGDSGGPVYTVVSGGSVLAKGIISGQSGYGGPDNYSGALDDPCVNIFTDIMDAYFSMPGDVSVWS